MIKSFSIVICTHNRSELLRETLESLFATSMGTVEAGSTNEIIVVNNNCTDDTDRVVESFMARSGFVRLCHESAPGLSNARNRGIIEAKGEISIFLDDDLCLNERTIFNLMLPFESSPDIAVVGGKVVPYLATIPAWLPSRYHFLVSVFNPGDKLMDVDCVLGALFAVDRAVFKETGMFDVELGRRGDLLLGGEEVELFKRIRGLGKRVIFTPDSVVQHKIAAKLTLDYITKCARMLGWSEAHIERKHARFRFILKLARSIVHVMFLPPCLLGVAGLDERNTERTGLLIKACYAFGYVSFRKSKQEGIG